MIHSNKEEFQEIISFCKMYNNLKEKKPLVVVPTSFNKIKEDHLKKLGVNIVIYANHLLRSTYPSMVNTAKTILKNQRSYEANKVILPIRDLLKLVPGTE
jgi:phosphoenolpyruvate phosphomutase